MPLQDWMKIISVDDHVIEHPRVWQDRLSAAHREQGPQIIETPAGHHVWRFEGQLFPQLGLNAVAGRPPEEYGMDPVRYDQMIPGCYDPVERIKDMDIDGVHAALSFPSFPGFGGNVFHRAKDKELALACVRAWNDFQVDEWCATAPDRLIPLGILPTWDPQLAAAEVERLAQIGTRAVSFPDSPVPLGLPSFHHPTHWEPLWDALKAADIPVCLHFGSGGFVPGFSFVKPSAEDPAPFAVAIATFSTNLMWSTADLVFSGMLQRHPNLKFLLSEGGIGWIPYLLERLDYTWERHRWYQNISRTDRPSDLFRKHIWGCFIDDVHGVKSRETIGIDRILIEVDYPHSDSNWPNSRKRIAENLIEVDDDDAHRIVELNARALLRFG
ncbi:amidohydrolase [Mycobacterium intermedium]|uniref:Amidohydrolase n=1 Tax=Mycobacterium intermedium TaxID=28445 RepID=A0A1E3SL01_MYCIE|nr:amidohydrolase family protein [Mycobacterium intermedium]MCV6963421.1 amidohydrolase [Mycobacterium intermedium]ODR02817.1 amidohydrolase [Mycobacterium intermedium]OPE47656.1 amidohydrolase [Mycobacterium intermedium]ORA98672.1 amidohydrolase [Mycobacterium intermedium]